MKKRLSPYAIALLAAALLAVIPAAILPDLAIPMKDNWENWYWSGQPHPRPQFSLANPPPLFRAELTTYKSLSCRRRFCVGLPLGGRRRTEVSSSVRMVKPLGSR